MARISNAKRLSFTSYVDALEDVPRDARPPAVRDNYLFRVVHARGALRSDVADAYRFRDRRSEPHAVPSPGELEIVRTHEALADPQSLRHRDGDAEERHSLRVVRGFAVRERTAVHVV
eukprot:31479-Pelagococcus_subviridis.AAC.4